MSSSLRIENAETATAPIDETAGRQAHVVALGRLLPLLIATCFAADVLSRFLPLDVLCFQGWECLTRYQEPGAIFQANRQFRSAHTHGNLSNMGNLRHLRQDRPQVFTTDQYGFRNVRPGGRAAPDALVVGDSFVAGYGLSDYQTLPAALSIVTGRDFYNAGGPYAYRATVRSLKSKLGMQRGRVIVVWTESVPVSFFEDAEARARTSNPRVTNLSAMFGVDGQRFLAFARGWWYGAPVKIAAEKAYLRLSDGRILPNLYAQRVAQRRLVNGQTMLFYPPDIEEFHRVHDIRAAAAYLASLTSDFGREGFDPLVVLAPNKYTVYYPLLDGPQPLPGDTVHPYAPLAAALAIRRVPVLDLTEPFREHARLGLSSGKYLYWHDDTHWNGSGTALAANLIHRAWFQPDSAP